MRTFVLFLAAILCGTIPVGRLGSPAVAQSPQQDSTAHQKAANNSEPTRWQVAGSDCQLRVISQRRLAAVDRDPAADRFRVVMGHGEFAFVACPIQPLTVIDELKIGVPLKSSHAGQQAWVRVVLPRSADPKTGLPITFRVAGEIYDSPRAWQTLKLPNIASEIDKHVRILRTQHGSQVDGREAFVDYVLVNLFASHGVSTVLVGNPTTRGGVLHQRARLHPSANADITGNTGRSEGSIEGSAEESLLQQASASVPLSFATEEISVRLESDLLLVGDRPFSVRAIQARGEDWAYLKRLGFNTLQLSRPVTGQQIQRAEELRLWLIAPPPTTWANGDLGQPYRRVIAWDLGHQLTSRDLANARARANAIRTADGRAQRPILCSPDTELAAFDEFTDILLHHREPFGSCLPLGKYRDWLNSRSSLSQASTPHWAMIQTEPLATIQKQAALFGFDPDELHIPTGDLQSLALSAVASGVRGLVFASRNRLDVDTSSARRRSAALQSMNLTLDSISPWIASGQVAARGIGNEPDESTTVIRTARSWLVLPSQQDLSGNIQGSHHEHNQTNKPLTIPGIPHSIDAFAFQPFGLSRLTHTRTAGGICLANDDSQRILLMTRDPLVIQHIHRKLAGSSSLSTELESQLTKDLCLRTEQLFQRINRSTELLEPVEQMLTAADADRAAGKFIQSHTRTQHVAKTVQGVRQQLARERQRDVESQMLPWLRHVETAGWSIPYSRSNDPGATSDVNQSTSLLAAGEFEDLAFMRAAGWRNWEHQPEWIQSQVTLCDDAPKQGAHCLRLTTQLADSGTRGPLGQSPTNVDNIKGGQLEKPPIWITSPRLNFEPGTQVLIRGWIRMTAEPRLCHDGVLIFDSVGGPQLAVRAKVSADWQPFSMIRAVDETGELSLTIALTGIGQVDVDGLSMVTIGHHDANHFGQPITNTP